jgi:hypothetical protein
VTIHPWLLLYLPCRHAPTLLLLLLLLLVVPQALLGDLHQRL